MATRPIREGVFDANIDFLAIQLQARMQFVAARVVADIKALRERGDVGGRLADLIGGYGELLLNAGSRGGHVASASS